MGSHRRNWNDWGTVDPLYAVLTAPEFRHGGGDVAHFFDSGTGDVGSVMKRLDELGVGQDRRRALDFGCGVGRLTVALVPYFDEVVGLDVAGSMIERARQFHGDRCRFEINSDEHLGRFDSDSFDLLLCLLVLQHLPSSDAIRRYLQEFVRVLRPGGALVVQVPTRVPSAPALTRRQKVARLLRRVGVSPRYLYRRMGWVPEMTMTALAAADVESVVTAAGGVVLATDVQAPDPENESWTYYVTK